MSRPWDIFCKVVDNYGDIGVCWRLARQLVAEHGLQVRLWVDDLHSFARLDHELDPSLARQTRGGITVRHWVDAGDLAEAASAAVVIEAFGCGLPETLLRAMADRAAAPVWINLEYLSAEPWVAGCHGVASPHPRLPLVRHFYFPGPGPGAGGLLSEQHLQQRRLDFQADAGAQLAFWRKLGLPQATVHEQRVSMFGYPGAPLASLLEIWADTAQPTTLLVPEGVFENELREFFGSPVQNVRQLRRGALSLWRFPFLHQDDYDRLLWACDVNFVRGEDSLVRALWAGRPMLWQIYPQEAGAHRVKLDALLALYCVGMRDNDADVLHALWHAWNSSDPALSMLKVWQAFQSGQELWRRQALSRPAEFLKNGDLAGNLLNFVAKHGPVNATTGA